MKFGRYLKENITPEWQSSYLDYPKLKLLLRDIPRNETEPEEEEIVYPPYTNSPDQAALSSPNTIHSDPVSQKDQSSSNNIRPSPPQIAEQSPSMLSRIGSRHSGNKSTPSTPMVDALTDGLRSRFPGKETLRRNSQASRLHYHTLPDILDALPVDSGHTRFFEALDQELLKVDTFYRAREYEASAQHSILKVQLDMLAKHRKEFHIAFPKDNEDHPWVSAQVDAFNEIWRKIGPALTPLKNGVSTVVDQPILKRSKNLWNRLTKNRKHLHDSDDEEATTSARAQDIFAARQHISTLKSVEEYKHSKRQLKAALLENYKLLELLLNFRILNRTGFAKILKKYEKWTDSSEVKGAYLRERVEDCKFASSTRLDNLIADTQELFTTHFTHGNRKRALERLRGVNSPGFTSHGFSLFRTGIMLGVSVPAVVAGSYYSYTHRDVLPQWEALLQIYGACFLPILFLLLFGVNMHAFTQARINYIFMFEWDVRSVLSYQQFFEIPAFFMLLLSYCFYFTFAQIGKSNIAPVSWPLIWLVFVVAFIVNPFPIIHSQSRFWIVRSFIRVLLPGLNNVEFRDFFLADELNSLVFSIYNIEFLACAQNQHWPSKPFDTCNPNSKAVVAFLAAIPPGIRLIQCFRRYFDSNFKMRVHLINGGKYVASIMANVLYFYWRANDSERGKAFAVWVTFAIVNSIYTTCWDLLMDWSLLQRGETVDYPFLRKDLLYGFIPVYYFAIVCLYISRQTRVTYQQSQITNVIIRFIWVFYIPAGLPVRLRSFVFALVEILRRWQWNFFRLENEQLSNRGQYRVIRDVPLPYDFTRTMTQNGPHVAISNNITNTSSGRAGRSRSDSVFKTVSHAINPPSTGGARGPAAARDHEPSKPRPAIEDDAYLFGDDDDDDDDDCPVQHSGASGKVKSHLPSLTNVN